MVEVSFERPEETTRRLRDVIAGSNFTVCEGAYSFAEFPLSELDSKVRPEALALIRIDEVWSQLIPSRIGNRTASLAVSPRSPAGPTQTSALLLAPRAIGGSMRLPARRPRATLRPPNFAPATHYPSARQDGTVGATTGVSPRDALVEVGLGLGQRIDPGEGAVLVHRFASVNVPRRRVAE